ncbi:MAG: hypothetical protein GX416_11520 [Bacteroidales bacterium]|nr:hypothetical protein [Bacteroidales bacterium]
MDHYYVNRHDQETGEHEVHTGSCRYLPEPENRIYLGYFSNCKEALEEAKKYYSDVDGCYYCCRPCNTK